jgi:hypothetical protein
MVRKSPNAYAMKFERPFRGSSGYLAVENLFGLSLSSKEGQELLMWYM